MSADPFWMQSPRPFKLSGKGRRGPNGKILPKSLIGSIFSATSAAAALVEMAGVGGEVFYNVFFTSVAGCGGANTALENFSDRQV